jgi:hypothetical protein
MLGCLKATIAQRPNHPFTPSPCLLVPLSRLSPCPPDAPSINHLFDVVLFVFASRVFVADDHLASLVI